MRHAILCLAAVVSALSLPVLSRAAQRTFVSTAGSDANTATNCSNSTPCRSFTAAQTVTDAGGEIVALSSGGYGPVAVTKSLAIVAPEGVHAAISVTTPSTHGVTIATGGVNVVLRGLVISALASGNHGVYMTSGTSLSIENCIIENFGSGYAGVYVSTPAKVRLAGSVFRSNSFGGSLTGGVTAEVTGSRFIGNGSTGLYVGSAPALTTTAIVGHSVLSQNDFGLYASASTGGTVRVDFKDSVAGDNGTQGLFAEGGSGAVIASISGSLISGSIYGVRASGLGATAAVGGNTITRNGTGLLADTSGVLESTGDNIVRNNGINASGISTISKL